MPFDQRENFRRAILHHKARVARIESILGQPFITSIHGQPVRAGEGSLLRLEEEKQERLFKMGELERELERLDRQHTIAGIPASARLADADAWRDFHDEFETLRKEESSGDPRNWVTVTASSVGDMTEWNLSGGGETLRAHLEALATRAGAMLGPGQGSTILNYWLHQLYLELKKSDSKLLFEPDYSHPPKAALITRVTEASAIFCARLEQKAIESEAVEGPQRGRRAPPNKKPIFCAKDESYQRFEFLGREYHLTPQAGAIVKFLYEAKGNQVARAEIRSKVGCGKISDSFRRLDGPEVWKNLIVVTKGRKGFYNLHPQAFTHSQ